MQTTKKRRRIGIIEDDISCRFVYEDILQQNYELVFYQSWHEIKQKPWRDFSAHHDLFIIDMLLSDGCFLDFFSKHLTRNDLNLIPFMIVSVNDEIPVQEFCFQNGAIDYLTKPFNKNELMVKVNRILNNPQHTYQYDFDLPQSMRSEVDALGLMTHEDLHRPNNLLENSNDIGRFHDFHLNLYSSTIAWEREMSQQLTPKEYRILSLFMNAPANRLKRDEIYESLWMSYKVSAKTIDVHLSNLRKKIALSGLKIRFETPYYILEKCVRDLGKT